jgi:glycosyltransferase involved in cell wall biosynthesis
MNVLYDYSIFQLQRYGGISRYFYELISRLSKSNEVNINLFEGFHINEYGLSKDEDNFGLYRGFKTPSFKGCGYVSDKLNRIWFKKTYDDFSNLNIFHPTYYRQDIYKFRKSCVVLTVYDMIHELFENQSEQNNKVINAKKSSIDSSDVIICISENTKKDLIDKYSVSKEKVKVVYLANSLTSDGALGFNELKVRYRIQKPYILYVGARNGYKNFSLLSDVYINHFSSVFDLVCFGGGKFTQDELRKIKNNNLFNKVIQINGSDRILASLYKNAFCFIYPSLYEGFGIPPLEAMVLGCPVIASNVSSIPEVVEDAGILFDPHSEESLTSSTESLLNDNLRSRLIQNGFEQEKKFNWDKTALKTLKVYESIS